ncbi:MAG: 1,4-dihydroxy-2-naphthoate polyprenyltransferase [Acidimicrobiia bacterium]
MNRWVDGARPRTLPAAVVPVVVGTAAAAGGVGISFPRAAGAMVVALAIQVFTNYQNDYADGVRGTDDHRVGPTRLVAGGLATAAQVRKASLVAAAVAAAAGAALAAVVGPELLLVGGASLAAGYFYTGGPRPYGYAGLGEVFVFVFFGLVATIGSAYVQGEEVSLLAIGAAVPVGLLATALLVVNNLRDIPSDAVAGKRTLAVRLGDGPTRAFYAGLVAAAFASVPLLALRRPAALLAFVALPFAARHLRRIAGQTVGPGLVPVLVDTGRLQLVFGLLLGAGLALSA